MSNYSEAIAQYIEKAKGWSRTDYSIQPRGLSPDGLNQIFAVVHRDDLQAAAPGAGKSVELYVDPVSRQIVRELSGQ